MMVVCNVGIIVDGCLIDLNANSEVVTTSTLSVTRIDVVLLVFGKVVPFRIARSFSEVIPSRSPAASIDNLSSGQWVTRVQAHIELTTVIAMHVESVASSSWSHEPALDFIAKVIVLVGWHFKLSEQCLSVAVMIPVGPINGAGLIVEFRIQSMGTSLRYICFRWSSGRLELA
jgi:hypothetical protein